MEHQFIVETSARHLHLSDQDLKTLFGEDAVLHSKKELSQPGQYACEERLTVTGPKGDIKGVSILGPTRPSTQLELSLTDARKLGIMAPVRESGDTVQSPGCKLVGPCGTVDIAQGVIIAKRHIHMTPQDAQAFGVSDKQVVWVQIDSPNRKLIFGDVIVRVHPEFALAMHIDTDEANAAGCIPGKTFGEIITSI